MKMILAEFTGKNVGYFRLKPLYKIRKKVCPRCGKSDHIGKTTCDIKRKINK